MTEWQLGINAFQEGRLREAADRLRAAERDHQRTVSQAVSFQTYTYLGAALYALGDATGSAQAFAMAVRFNIGRTVPLDLTANLANAYVAAGEREEAERILVKALQDAPGAMELQTMLDRLRSRDGHGPLTGSIFGETPQSVKRYMESLSFSTVSQGYSPDQVASAFAQISRYIDVLSKHLTDRETAVRDYTAEIERLRQTEETLIENLVQSRQELDQFKRSDGHGQRGNGEGGQTQVDADSGANAASMTPLEKLFQKKNGA